jgi:hypothetical protein
MGDDQKQNSNNPNETSNFNILGRKADHPDPFRRSFAREKEPTARGRQPYRSTRLDSTPQKQHQQQDEPRSVASAIVLKVFVGDQGVDAADRPKRQGAVQRHRT